MMSPSEANFDEAALEAELEALHMSRYKLNVILYRQSSQMFVIINGTLRLKNISDGKEASVNRALDSSTYPS
jgi:hypothetical protein